jgi:hypothetical protein
VQKALCDKDPAVRMAAAKTFDSLHSTVGARYGNYFHSVILEKII